MTATTHDADLKYLRKELAARFDSYPSDDWSPRLLAALIAVFDLEFGGAPAGVCGHHDRTPQKVLASEVGSRTDLRVVR